MMIRTRKSLSKILRRHALGLKFALVAFIIYMVIVWFVVLHSIEPAGTKRLVTFYDRGTQQVVLTRHETVRGALKDANIELNPQDVLEPALDSELTQTHVDVIIYRSRLVAVADGSTRQSVVTTAQSPNTILKAAKLAALGPKDTAAFKTGILESEGTPILLSVERAEPDPQPQPQPQKVTFTPRPDALTASKGAHVFVDGNGVAHRETYYDLPMNVVIRACGAGGSYSIRSDGAKIDQDGYVLVAANLVSYPRCSVVETSLGPGKVYDTGGFALRHPYGFDLATDWTNYNGQ